jgi:hypothetical protein
VTCAKTPKKFYFVLWSCFNITTMIYEVRYANETRRVRIHRTGTTIRGEGYGRAGLVWIYFQETGCDVISAFLNS